MKMKNSQTVCIGEAAKITKVTVKQIRHWQEKGYIPERERIVVGVRAFRQFDETDIALIQAIKNNLDHGFTLKSAAAKAKQDIGGKNYA